MELNPIFEVVRIKQEIREVEAPFALSTIRSPEDAAKIASEYIADEDREVFFVMVLDTKNKVVAIHRAHVGSLNSCIVHPREVYKSAILNNGASIIVAHQHPSGSCQPSPEDLDVTKRLIEGGQLLGIELLDHVIVSYTGDYISLKEKGYI